MMKNKKILITGGAGFIGSFLADRLIIKGYEVRILDNLENQVHHGKIPKYLNPKAEFIKGDVKDYKTMVKALQGMEVVFHLAARVGIGQSNYKIKDYVDSNIGGMANLFDIAVNKKNTIKKILMTASMTSYGEGNYSCSKCGIVKPSLRLEDQMKKKQWELLCPNCHKQVLPIATDESAQINNNSIYALTKNTQEEMLFFIGNTYNIPIVSFRCFNVYGPRQSLSNPYTGVTAIFISRLKNNKAPIVYEDGLQSRDFVSVHDVVEALILGMESDKSNNTIMNIGGGRPVSIREIALTLSKLLKKNLQPKINGEFRKNDIRNCFADISKAKKILGWYPSVNLEEGLKELIKWSEGQESLDNFDKAEEELRNKNLL